MDNDTACWSTSRTRTTGSSTISKIRSSKRTLPPSGCGTFLVTEIMFFGGLFLAYFVYRQAYPAAFASASNNTDLWLGAANTTVLICSSLTMALAVHFAALGKSTLIVTFLILTLLLGGMFLGVKAYEYHDKWVKHEVPGEHFDCRDDQGKPCADAGTPHCSSRSILRL